MGYHKTLKTLNMVLETLSKIDYAIVGGVARMIYNNDLDKPSDLDIAIQEKDLLLVIDRFKKKLKIKEMEEVKEYKGGVTEYKIRTKDYLSIHIISSYSKTQKDNSVNINGVLFTPQEITV
jgi:hypothetical protein